MLKIECPYCDGDHIVSNVCFSSGSEEFARTGLIWSQTSLAGATIAGIEMLLADICEDCGSIVRFHVRNPKRKWKKIPANIERGEIWTDRAELETAIQHYTKCIALDPNNAMAYADRGFAWEAKGEIDNAINDYATALTLNPTDDNTQQRLDSVKKRRMEESDVGRL